LRVRESFDFVGTENSARTFEVQTLKDQPAVMSGEIFLRYPLSRNGHPGSAKNMTLSRLRRAKVKISSDVNS
jgi:hypothetical protein